MEMFENVIKNYNKYRAVYCGWKSVFKKIYKIIFNANICCVEENPMHYKIEKRNYKR